MKIVFSSRQTVSYTNQPVNMMSISRAENLINKLISNKLSGKELSEILEGISNDENRKHYSDILEKYFTQLLAENEMEVGSVVPTQINGNR